MVASIPIQNKGEDPCISQVFAKSKWFAIVDDDTISFEKNTNKDGINVANWLYDLGVTHIVTNKIGQNTYNKLKEMDILCLGVDINLKFTEIVQKLKSNKLNKIDEKDSIISKSCEHK